MKKDPITELHESAVRMADFAATPVRPLPGKSEVNKPMAAKGLKSYRYRGRYGHIAIGAHDHDDALREAGRSTSGVKKENLDVWDGKKYVPAHGKETGNFAANSDAAHQVSLKYGANPRIKKFKLDTNGNMRVHVGEKTGGSVSIQTNGTLPHTHSLTRNSLKAKDISPEDHDKAMGEIHSYIAKHGTKRHKEILGHATGGGSSDFAAAGYTHGDMPQGGHKRNWTQSAAKLIKHHESMQHHKNMMKQKSSDSEAVESHKKEYQTHWDGWHNTMRDMKKSHKGAGISPKMNDHIISQVASGNIKNHREAYAVATKNPDMNKGTGDNL